MAGLRQRTNALRADEAGDRDQEPELFETDAEDLLVRPTGWQRTKHYLGKTLSVAGTVLRWGFAGLRTVYRVLDQHASIVLGNQRRWVGSEPRRISDGMIEWYRTYRQRIMI